MPWMVVRTQPQREQLVQHQIRGLCGRETYWPRFRDWRTGKIKSLYPNYLFVEETPEWGFLRVVFGAISPIFIDGAPGLVPDIHIEDLQAQEDSEGLILIDVNIGHPVTVVRGDEMLGWSGIYYGMADHDRCEVLFNVIGQPLTKIVSTKNIRAESLNPV
jgi:hypothetical protein